MERKLALFMVFIYIICAFFPFFYYWFEDVNLNPNDYARITDVDYKAVLVDEKNSNGKVIVTERLTYDIHAASKNNPFWELWRDLPEDYVDGLKVNYKVNSVKQVLDDGTKIEWQESPQLYWEDEDYIDTYGGLGPGKWYHSPGPYNEYAGDYECIFFYIDGLYREKITFEIEYEMYNAALRYKDCSELYLSMYSEDTIKYLNSFKGQILIPEKDMPRIGNYEAHTYGTNSHEFPFTESTTVNPGYHTFSFELDESDLKFRPYNEYIEFDLISYGNDKHIFTEHANDNYYSNDYVLQELRDEQEEYEAEKTTASANKLLVIIISSFVSIIIIKNASNKDFKMRQKYNFYEPTVLVDYFREIPSNLDPNFAAELVFCKDKKPKDVDGYAALMLSLVRKKYIELKKIDDSREWVPSNVKIVEIHKNIDPPFDYEPLTRAEEIYFNLIVRYTIGTNEITMQEFRSKISSDYLNTEVFVSKIDNSITTIGTSEGYLQKANFEEPKKQLRKTAKSMTIWGIIFITLVNIISYNTRLDLAYGSFFLLGFSLLASALHYYQISKKYVLLTPFGEDEYVKWRGLYNFLNSETLMNERTFIELPLWEQYLVYATAFGISDKVTAALKIRCPEIMDTNSLLSNPYYRSTSFRYSSRSFRTATHSAVRSARAHSYGGYGGGSWRIWWRRPWRRWWPEAVINKTNKKNELLGSFFFICFILQKNLLPVYLKNLFSIFLLLFVYLMFYKLFLKYIFQQSLKYIYNHLYHLENIFLLYLYFLSSNKLLIMLTLQQGL